MANAPKGKRGTARTGVKKPVATQAPQQKSGSATQATAKSGGGSGGGSGPWSPQAPGGWIERDPRTGQAISIAHAGRPWMAGDSNALNDDELRDIATGYVLAVNEVLQLPTRWLDDLARKDASGPLIYQLRWKPFGSDPRGSFRCTRRAANGKVLDETAVLLACLAVPVKQELVFLNGGQGLRVTMHVDRAPANTPHRVRVTSVTTSLPPWTDHDVALAWTASLEAVAKFIPAGQQFNSMTLGSLVTTLNTQFRSAFGMPASTTLKDFGLRFTAPPGGAVPRPDFFELLAKSAPPATDLDSLSHRLVLGLRRGTTIEAEAKDMAPLLTHAAPPQRVFVVDPVTRTGIRARNQVQPHLPSAALNGKRDLVPLDGVTAGVGAGRFLLADGTHVDVVRSYVAGDAAPVDTSVEFDSAAPFSSRSNTQAAVNTYFHFKSLIRRLEGYGFIAKDYLSFADMPLKVKYRGGILPGARGQ